MNFERWSSGKLPYVHYDSFRGKDVHAVVVQDLVKQLDMDGASGILISLESCLYKRFNVNNKRTIAKAT